MKKGKIVEFLICCNDAIFYVCVQSVHGTSVSLFHTNVFKTLKDY